MSVKRFQDGPGQCDWCGEDILDLEEEGGRLKIRLHGMRVASRRAELPEPREEDDYIKVKVRCAACGHVNVVVGCIPRLPPAPLEEADGTPLLLFGE